MISVTDVPRLHSVELENIRGLASLRLDFGRPRPGAGSPGALRQRATVVIGQNGTNKSTLLRAIALGLAARTDASAMLATETGSFVRHGASEGRIVVELRYPDDRSVKVVKTLRREGNRSDVLVDSEGPSAEELNLLVCGYGAARGITGTDSGRDYRVFDAVSTLFDYRRELLSPELTLRRLSDHLGEARFQAVLTRIARAMGLSGDTPRIEFGRGGGVTISADEVGDRIPLEALADGYRVTFNWLLDLYGRALRPDWLTEEGSPASLVLVDEIDQHLHPELQTRVVAELTRVIPDAQYVVTTHSPLVALGAHPSQLVVLERRGQEVIRVERDQNDDGGNPIVPLGTWSARAAAKTVDAIADRPAHEVSDLYAEDDLRASLEKLFRNKCAYCESHGIAGFPWDVEHYRPKGRVAEDDTHPGYYWLAYTWTNLYPSCVFCNQNRRDKPTFDDPAEGAAAGKLDQFPLDPPGSRAHQPGDDLDAEGRLLLDPCHDLPEDHVGFNAAAEAQERAGSVLGATSIRVFNLNRKRLRDARRGHLDTMQELIDENVAAGMDRAATTTVVLTVFARGDKQYAGLVRAVQADQTAFGF